MSIRKKLEIVENIIAAEMDIDSLVYILIQAISIITAPPPGCGTPQKSR
jgi:hypothetical protein